MEVLIPQGKELRYRCAVAGCRWPEKALSMCTMVEHLAYHYAKIRGYSKDHFYYRCKKCGNQFYFLSMTSTCLCRKSGRQSECVVITRQWSQEAVQRDVDFFKFVEQHSVPVFVAEKDKQVGERDMLPGSKRNAEEFDTSMTRSPLMHDYSTPTTFVIDDDEESNASHNARGTPRIHPSGSASFLVTENVSGQAERRPQKDDGGSHRTPTFQSPHWRSYQDPVHQRNATRRRSLEQTRVARPPSLPLSTSQWDPSQPGPNRSSYDSSAFSSDISESEHPLRPPTPSQSSLDLCGGMRSGQFGQHPRVSTIVGTIGR